MTSSENESGATQPTPVADLDAEERVVKREEIAARNAEAQRKIAEANSPWWRNASPLTAAIVAAAVTMLGNIYVAWTTGQNSLEQEKAKASAVLAAEKEKNKATLILQAVSTSDKDAAKRNVQFFLESGFFKGQEEDIKKALEHFAPVLPSNSTTRRDYCKQNKDCGDGYVCNSRTGDCVIGD